MDQKAYAEHCSATLERLAGVARSKDEFAYLHAILGINSGVEDAGWQPIDETRAFVEDFVQLIHAPLDGHTKTRLALVTYCHITEADFLYHDVINLLFAADGQPPRVFNFLHKYQSGRPPSVNAKLADIKENARRMGFNDIVSMFDEVWKPNIRNAVFHSDYILFRDELRLKHRGGEIAKIPLEEVFGLFQKTIHLFSAVLDVRMKGLRSFEKGYRITGRKSAEGHNLASIEVIVDEQSGLARGFRTSDPLPIW